METKVWLYVLVGVIAVLAVVSVLLMSRTDEDQLTAWATVKSSELHTFMKDCKENGGSVDTRPNNAPQIVFVCQYPDRMVEYTLVPGK